MRLFHDTTIFPRAAWSIAALFIGFCLAARAEAQVSQGTWTLRVQGLYTGDTTEFFHKDPIVCVPCDGHLSTAGITVDTSNTEELPPDFDLEGVYIGDGVDTYWLDLSTDLDFLTAYASGDVDTLEIEDPYGFLAKDVYVMRFEVDVSSQLGWKSIVVEME